MNRVVRASLIAAVLIVASHPLSAQRPGEIVGVVVDDAASAGIEGVDIRLLELGQHATTNGTGRFVLRAIEAGDWTLRVERLGFAGRTVAVTVRNGATARVTVRLLRTPIEVDVLRVTAVRAGNVVHIDRAALERSGARTAGDALRDVAGVTVRSSGPGAPQLASVRGMAPDAVLVLVDGVPINDPVTGEADLSRIDASGIASIMVLPGAQSARFGGRAMAGVITIQTRSVNNAERRFSAGAGSLGAWDASVVWAGSQGLEWTAGASARGQDGAFEYALPDEVGGGQRRRANADVRAWDAQAGVARGLPSGRMDLRAGYDRLERGLPGRGFAPSPHARQETGRARASLAWRRVSDHADVSILLAGTRQDVTNVDPLPPFGQPYADTVRTTYVETRVDAERAVASGVVVGGGVEVRHQHIAGTVLADDAPDMQLDAGVFAHGAAPLARAGGGMLHVAAQVRVDRDRDAGGIVTSHSMTATWATDPVALHVAHRSSYSPPTPGDRFFRDAVGVAPNPDLRAERVPAELEAGASVRLGIGRWDASLRAAAYRGDVDGMIVWAPDYRFVWSPYNQDAARRGAELSAELVTPDRGARVSATWSYVRATYDREGGDDDVQIAYRPRHTAVIDASARVGAVRIGATLRHTGTRTTAPTALNTLPAFRTLDVSASADRRIGGWSVGIDARVDRVLDTDDTLIFGYPEPGRTLRLGVRVNPFTAPTTPSIGAAR